MYRVSREGRRASTHDHVPDSRPTRYKERFDDTKNVSAPAAFHDKSFPAARPSVLSTRYPRMNMCLKVAAIFVGIFFVRKVTCLPSFLCSFCSCPHLLRRVPPSYLFGPAGHLVAVDFFLHSLPRPTHAPHEQPSKGTTSFPL